MGKNDNKNVKVVHNSRQKAEKAAIIEAQRKFKERVKNQQAGNADDGDDDQIKEKKANDEGGSEGESDEGSPSAKARPKVGGLFTDEEKRGELAKLEEIRRVREMAERERAEEAVKLAARKKAQEEILKEMAEKQAKKNQRKKGGKRR